MQRSWRYKRIGFYTRRCPPRRIQRYLCLSCRVSFSSQTFHTSYYLKRPDILPQLLTKANGAMANRQIARDLRVSPTTIDNQLSRLGRHCLLFHAHHLPHAKLKGDLVIDGFETFEYSQYHPFHFNLAVEADTSFIRYFTDSELRRKGRMREDQKRRREFYERRDGRADPKAVQKGIEELLRVCLAGCQEATVRSDDHRAYPVAIRRQRCRITHLVTSSKQRRDRRNPLWEVNLADLLIRHSQAGHRRETICWAKRRQKAAERLVGFVVWRNWGKRRWENGPAVSPAMLAGVAERIMTAEDILEERIFRGHVELPPRWGMYYEGRVETRALAVNRKTELKRAM
jgi:transposase-like protein